MSTYLVAFVIGEFEYIEGTSSDNVLVRVYTPCGKTDQGQFALDVRIVSWNSLLAAFLISLRLMYT